MSDISNALGIDPALARMSSAESAMVRAKSGLSAKKLADIDASAKDFEAMFISQMLQPMFDTVQTDSEFGGGEAEDTWKGLMVEQYGKEITAAGGIGLSDSIKATMIQMQEAAQGPDDAANPASDLINKIAQGSLDGSAEMGSK